MKSITYDVTVDQNKTVWELNGKRHREDGPALEFVSGSKAWYINDQLHRIDGPAIEWIDGDKEWYINDQLHRIDGPALEWFSGDKQWFINGKELKEEEFLQRTKPAIEMTIEEIEKLLGKRIKIVKTDV